jgi:hypothetical protein
MHLKVFINRRVSLPPLFFYPPPETIVILDVLPLAGNI